MPVRRFRSLEEMGDSLWREPGDPELWRAMQRVWRFAAETCPLRFPPGVYRHRSIEEAKRLREVWDEASFRALWEVRGVSPEDLARTKFPRDSSCEGAEGAGGEGGLAPGGEAHHGDKIA